ncbi:MAG: MmoB/DmpM family protein [Alphaproteobacteria bacterium]
MNDKDKKTSIEEVENVSHEDHIKEIQYDEDTFDAQAFQDKFLSQDKIRSTNSVTMALMKSEEIEFIVEEFLANKEGVYVEDRSAFYYVGVDTEVVLDFDEIEEALGRPYNVYDFLVNLSTTVGRALTVGNKFVLTTRLVGLEMEVDEEPAAT